MKNQAVSLSWVLNQLAGMRFPAIGGAYDFIKKSAEVAVPSAPQVAPALTARSALIRALGAWADARERCLRETLVREHKQTRDAAHVALLEAVDAYGAACAQADVGDVAERARELHAAWIAAYLAAGGGGRDHLYTWDNMPAAVRAGWIAVADATEKP